VRPLYNIEEMWIWEGRLETIGVEGVENSGPLLVTGGYLTTPVRKVPTSWPVKKIR